MSESDFNAQITNLDDDACDVLMKYIYRSLEKANNASNMLKFHAHLNNKCGIGTIVRVMTDRKTV